MIGFSLFLLLPEYCVCVHKAFSCSFGLCLCFLESFCNLLKWSVECVWQLGFNLVNLIQSDSFFGWLKSWTTFSCATEEFGWWLVFGFCVPQYPVRNVPFIKQEAASASRQEGKKEKKDGTIETQLFSYSYYSPHHKKFTLLFVWSFMFQLLKTCYFPNDLCCLSRQSYKSLSSFPP